MKATGTKLQLVVRLSMTSRSIDPSGWSRSSSAAPSRMLNVPSVAMIEGRRKHADEQRVEDPGREPDAHDRERARDQTQGDVVGVIVYEATTTHSVISAPTETSKPPTSSALVWPIETSASGIVASSRLLRL